MALCYHYLAVWKARTQIRTLENHANLLGYLANWPLYFPENVFSRPLSDQLRPCSSFLEKNARTGPYKKKQKKNSYAMCTVDYQSTTCVGTWDSSHHPFAPLCWRALNLYFHFQVIELSEQTEKSCGSDCTIRSGWTLHWMCIFVQIYIYSALFPLGFICKSVFFYSVILLRI